MLARYRRRGGFIQLLNLIESSPPQKRENFLALISQESKVWETEIRKRILSFERILSWNPQYLSEIFSRIQPMNLAVAFRGVPTDKSKLALSGLSPSFLKNIELENSERQPTSSEIFTCQIKVLEEARQLIKKGILKLEKVDPELFINEKIEEIIADQEAKQQAESFSSSHLSNLGLSSQNETKRNDDSLRSLNDTSLSSRGISEIERVQEKVFTEEDLKKFQELSASVQSRSASLNIDGKNLNDSFFKQIQQELLGIKTKIERLHNENHSLRRELDFLKAQEQKIKEELALVKRENQSIKIELLNSRTKLDQIKKIA